MEQNKCDYCNKKPMAYARYLDINLCKKHHRIFMETQFELMLNEAKKKKRKLLKCFKKRIKQEEA